MGLTPTSSEPPGRELRAKEQRKPDPHKLGAPVPGAGWWGVQFGWRDEGGMSGRGSRSASLLSEDAPGTGAESKRMEGAGSKRMEGAGSKRMEGAGSKRAAWA